MDGLTDAEYTRFLKLQEICPEDNLFDLHSVALPHLKSEKAFNIFVNDILEKKLKNNMETEEERHMNESLRFAFTKRIPLDPISQTLKKNAKLMTNERLDFVETSNEPSVWDNPESILEEIISGITNDHSEKGEAVKSDSDESFHSVDGGEPENKPFSSVKENREKDFLDRIGKAVNNRNVKLKGAKNNDETMEPVISNKICNGDGDKKETPKIENHSSGTEGENSKKTFSSFNSLLIMKKKDEVTLKPEEKSEEKKNDSANAELAESKDKISKMIDLYMFQQNGIGKEKLDAPHKMKTDSKNNDKEKKKPKSIPLNPLAKEFPAKNYEKLGAIPKTVNSSKTGSESRPISKPTEKSSRPMPLDKVASGNGKKDKIQNGNPEKKVETPIKNLEIPGFPFVYVVSENYSPAFRLPKGNYFITNTFPSVENLDAGFKILCHPSIIEEKKEVVEKPAKKPEVVTTKKEVPIPRIIPASLPAKPAERPPLKPLKTQPVKMPNSVKGKIFCNTPVQSLKKDSEEGIHSSDAYGSILQNVANRLKSGQKDEENKNVEPSDLDLSRDILLKKSSTKPECPVISRKEDETGEKPESSGSDDDSSMVPMAVLKTLNPDYRKRKLEKCGNDAELQKKVIEREVERSFQTNIETQKIREGYLKLLKELPKQDPEYLLNKWTEMAGDDAAIDAFVQNEKLKITLQDIKNRLFTNLPFLDRKFLESKAKDFFWSPQELETFITEEKKKMIIDGQYQNMITKLPWMDAVLLREKCEEFQGKAALVDDFIRAKTLEQQQEERRNNQIINMQLILPDADPAFLEESYEQFTGDDDAFNNWLFELLDSKNYRKIEKDDPVSRERSELWRRFVDNFDVKDFLSKIPNPEDHFCRSKGDDKIDIQFVMKFLQSRYPNSSVQDLERIFREKSNNLTNTCVQIDFEARPVEVMDVSFRNENIPESFLLEMVYILRRREIRDYLKQEKELRDLKVAEARKRKDLWPCLCCCEEELLKDEMTFCPNGDFFCIECVTRSVETKLSDADTSFCCLGENCDGEFSLVTLEKILPTKLYAKVLRKKQAAEVTKAKVPGLESCPSCDFAYIPNQYDKIFKCQNPDCRRETCRMCGEESHVPLRCEEVERPMDTQVRTVIEEKMTKALIRTCPQCEKKFVKTDGCNKMTCVCGAVSCYLCRQLVKDYTHFNGQGGDKFHLCPLFSNNEDLHVGAVRRVGQLAINEALLENPDVHLVYDPTASL